MSLRAGLVSFLMRHTVKKKMAGFDDPEEVRKQAGLPGGRIPDGVSVETVTAGGVPAEWVVGSPTDEAVMLYLHGGGYVFGGLDSHRDIACRLAAQAGVKVLLLDYRLAPEYRFPAAVDDATAAYSWLLDEGVNPAQLVIAGDSAGGGLATALMVNLKTLGLPQPKAAVLISPWVDLAMTGESLQANARADAMLSPEAIEKFASLYLGDSDPRSPLASPIFADLSGLPPAYVMVGDTEVLMSDAQTLVKRISEADGQVELTIWPKMPHVFPIMSAIIPEGRQAIEDISTFVRAQLELPDS